MIRTTLAAMLYGIAVCLSAPCLPLLYLADLLTDAADDLEDA